TLASRSEEPRPVSALEPPGVFGPQCGDHETLRTDAPTFGIAIVDGDGVPRTVLELLDNWLAGREPSSLVQTFDPRSPPRECRYGR
ncbi:MAG TPA: hypothetical protein VND91_02190, partial [Candidatus Saccharimonadia bacterium]|nr:hypothetical protein [Candidatus Saccharimonadia bacterium]